MLKWLKNLFVRQPKALVETITHTPAANFELAVMHTQQSGVRHLWKENQEIDALGDEISRLMDLYQKRITERSEFIIVLNKQRKILGLEEYDDNGELPSEQPAADENFALES